MKRYDNGRLCRWPERIVLGLCDLFKGRLCDWVWYHRLETWAINYKVEPYPPCDESDLIDVEDL